MTLSVTITPDSENSVTVTDLTNDNNGYIDEDSESILRSGCSFKYSETCTINVLKYVSSTEETLIDVYYSSHTTDSDSVRLPLTKDGYFIIEHLVLPTTDWLESFKDTVATVYDYVYVTDGAVTYKYSGDTQTVVDIEEVIELNSTKSTRSIASFKVFNIDGLKKCYKNAALQILNGYVSKCNKSDDTTRFNRDFLWATINVINYYLENDYYSEAQLILENLGCSLLCPDSSEIKSTNSDCGCHH